MQHILPEVMKEGLPPGTPVYTGEQSEHRTRIQVISYDDGALDRYDDVTPEQAQGFRGNGRFTWVDVAGLRDVTVIKDLCERFEIHSLAIEDILNPGGRPKMEDYEGFLFLITKVLEVRMEDKHAVLDMEHACLVIGPNYVLTFQEWEGDPFDPVRRRLQAHLGRVRRGGPDYLAYCLLDAVVDHYFVGLERLGIEVEELEEKLLAETPPEALTRIQDLRTAILMMRKAVQPLREAIGALRATTSHLVDQNNSPYLRDLYDHLVQVLDTIDVQREMIVGMIQLYHTGTAQRLNESIKVLTVISTIFIPLTFVVGVYGMNFDLLIPPTNWPPSFFVVNAGMLAIAVTMVAILKWRNWF